MLIWLSGPTGAGKSTLSLSLRASGYTVIEESAPPALFKGFSKDPLRYCYQLQRTLITSRFEAWSKVCGAPKIAFDRSIAEDINVFCEMHLAHHLLTTKQFLDLRRLSAELEEQIPPPDLIAYVSADPRVLRDRLRKLPAPPVILDNLDHQLTLYAAWLGSRKEDILKLDTTRTKTDTLTKLLRSIR